MSSQICNTPLHHWTNSQRNHSNLRSDFAVELLTSSLHGEIISTIIDRMRTSLTKLERPFCLSAGFNREYIWTRSRIAWQTIPHHQGNERAPQSTTTNPDMRSTILRYAKDRANPLLKGTATGILKTPLSKTVAFTQNSRASKRNVR